MLDALYADLIRGVYPPVDGLTEVMPPPPGAAGANWPSYAGDSGRRVCAGGHRDPVPGEIGGDCGVSSELFACGAQS